MKETIALVRLWLADKLRIDLNDDRGSVFSEYGMLVGIIGVAGAAGAAILAARVTNWFNSLP